MSVSCKAVARIIGPPARSCSHGHRYSRRELMACSGRPRAWRSRSSARGAEAAAHDAVEALADLLQAGQFLELFDLFGEVLGAGRARPSCPGRRLCVLVSRRTFALATIAPTHAIGCALACAASSTSSPARTPERRGGRQAWQPHQFTYRRRHCIRCHIALQHRA